MVISVCNTLGHSTYNIALGTNAALIMLMLSNWLPFIEGTKLSYSSPAMNYLLNHVSM